MQETLTSRARQQLLGASEGPQVREAEGCPPEEAWAPWEVPAPATQPLSQWLFSSTFGGCDSQASVYDFPHLVSWVSASVSVRDPSCLITTVSQVTVQDLPCPVSTFSHVWGSQNVTHHLVTSLWEHSGEEASVEPAWVSGGAPYPEKKEVCLALG